MAAAIGLCLVSCEKEFDIDYREIAPMTVLEANLTQSEAVLTITETTPMDQPMDHTLYTDATAVLEDLSDGWSSPMEPDPSGRYVLPLDAVPGHTYRLTVQRGGCTYTSVCEMLPPAEISGMEFSWIKMPYDHVAVLEVTVKDNPDIVGECFWLRVYRNGELYRQSLLRDSFAADGSIHESMMTTRYDIEAEDDDDLLLTGDNITATVAPLSDRMYDYLEGLENNSNSSRMYDGDFCLGYFLAAPITSKSITFNPDEFTGTVRP